MLWSTYCGNVLTKNDIFSSYDLFRGLPYEVLLIIRYSKMFLNRAL